MAWRNALTWFGLVTFAFIIGVAVTIAPTVGLSRLLFAPLALAGAVGAYLLGVRKSASASLRSRMVTGGRWAAPWALLLLLPWGVATACFTWERVDPILPPDAARLGAGYLPTAHGFKFGSTSALTWESIERHYRDRLACRGWRHQWTREFATRPAGTPPDAPLPRWVLFRRIDGLMLVSIGMLPNGRTAVVSDYMHLRWDFDADHLLRR